MRDSWLRMQRRVALLATGGVTLGILQGLSMVNFSWVFTQFLTELLSAFVVILFGGNAQQVLYNFGLGAGGTGTTT